MTESLPRVTLRHVTESDMPLLIRSVTDPGFSSDDLERLLVINEEGRAVGDVVHFVAHRYSTAREIGWTVFDPADRGQGYGTAGARALVDYLFRALPIHRLCCSLSPDNIASARVAQ